MIAVTLKMKKKVNDSFKQRLVDNCRWLKCGA